MLYKKNIFTVLFTVFSIILILLSSGYYLATVTDLNLSYIKLLYSFILFLVAFITLNRKVFYKSILMIVFILISLCAIIIFNDDRSFNPYIGYFILFVISLFFTKIISFKFFSSMTIIIMLVVSLISLFYYYLILTSSLLLPVIQNVNGVNYGNGIIFTYILGIEERNSALFWEPGLFATFLLFSIIFLNLKKTFPFKNIFLIVFYIALSTTFSTAGYFIGLIIFFLPLIKKLKIKKFFFNLYLIAFTLLFFLNFSIILDFFDSFIATTFANNPTILKLITENISNSSRYISIVENFKLFLSSPIFGIGFSNFYLISNNFSYFDVSTTLSLMSIFGFLGLLYFFSIVISSLRIKSYNPLFTFIIMVSYFLIVNKEPHQNILFTWIFTFYLFRGLK